MFWPLSASGCLTLFGLRPDAARSDLGTVCKQPVAAAWRTTRQRKGCEVVGAYPTTAFACLDERRVLKDPSSFHKARRTPLADQQ